MMLIVKDGKVLASAHRGEIARGEHAEFTLIERKLVGEDLTYDILPATLDFSLNLLFNGVISCIGTIGFLIPGRPN
jgi:F420-0:gamma-glutamyl ligase-like protein